jgi:hypothetical protein
MDVTGTRYLIAENVAAGSVMFGNTNTLNGAQWVKAFTDALRTNRPSWWDPTRHGFRHEDLVLLTRDGKTVLVLPEDMTPGYQERGFVPVR